MEITVSYRHMKHNDEMDQRVRQKSHKLEKYMKKINNLKWTLSFENGEGLYHVDAHLHGAGVNYTTKEQGRDLYDTQDKVIAHLEKFLRERHKMQKDHLHRNQGGKVADKIEDPEKLWSEHDENEDFDDVKKA